jgi:hypothetical protein
MIPQPTAKSHSVISSDEEINVMDDETVANIHQLQLEQSENSRLRDQIKAYRAFTLISLAFGGTFLAMLFFTRPGASHPSACQALKYYLDLISEDADVMPVETRKILDRKAAQCPPDELEETLDENPHQ